MRKTWKISFDFKCDGGGGNAGSYEIKTWNSGDALREVAQLLRNTAKDERAKNVKSMTISVNQKGG